MTDWTAQQLRHAFLLNTVAPASSIMNQALREAAVLIPLLLTERGCEVLLTVRNAHLSAHAGQISFPGGRHDPADRSLLATALRETDEEIGLAERHIEPLGMLPAYATHTGYWVHPVVALVHPPISLTINQDEVDEVFYVPLSWLLNTKHHVSQRFWRNGHWQTVWWMPWRHYNIWGVTAGILRDFVNHLQQHTTRVTE